MTECSFRDEVPSQAVVLSRDAHELKLFRESTFTCSVSLKTHTSKIVSFFFLRTTKRLINHNNVYTELMTEMSFE